MRAKLFVGNLSYDTSVGRLEEIFRGFFGFSHAKVRLLTTTGLLHVPQTYENRG